MSEVDKSQPEKSHQGLKMALEYGPIVAFFAAYMMVKDRVYTIGGREYEGFVLVTAGFVPLLLMSMGILWVITRHLSKMQIVTAVLVVVFGGLTVWLNDPKFLMMKPTLIYLLFGGALGIGLLRGESWLQSVMDTVLPLTHEGWMILTKRFMLFFFGLAVLNEIVWRTLSEETWVSFKTFGLTALVFAFFLTQGGLLKRHSLETEDEA